MGNVHDCPSLESLQASPVWRAFKDRQDRIEGECGDCPHLAYCRGGCPYNTLAAMVAATPRRVPSGREPCQSTASEGMP